MDKPVSPFIFTEYDKISDTLMWFGTSKYKLRFNVKLNRRDMNNKVKSFHSEFGFYNENMNKKCVNISRDYSYFYTIERSNDYNGSILLRQNDVEVLGFIIRERIYPWFFGSKSIYGLDQNNGLCLKKVIKPVMFPVSNLNWMSFKPIVITYENTHDSKQGVEIAINEESNTIELDIDNFLQFTSIILHTDMVNAAMNMLNYVKIKPYQVNYSEAEDENGTRKKGGGFFNNYT